MAFFIDEQHCYLSLSLDPAGPSKAYVFELTRRQVQVARAVLPPCLTVAALAAACMLALGLANLAGFAGEILSPAQQTLLACVLAIVAATTVFVELGWFLWVHRRQKSTLTETERRSLRRLRLVRRPSLTAYGTFLLAMLVPIMGILIVNRVDPESTWDAVSNVVIVGPLAIGVAILSFWVIKRIVNL